MATIRKRHWGDGKVAWVVDYFDQDGKRHIKTFKREREAKAWLVTTQHEVKHGVHTPESRSITVAEACDIWIDRVELEGRERGTVVQYRSHADLHIKPSRIGKEKLARLTTPAIEQFRDDLLRTCSRPLAQKVLTSLKSALKEAKRRGLVAQNAALEVRIESDKRKTVKLAIGCGIPSKPEVQAILAQAGGRWRPLLVTAIFTGMRASELRGLTWSAVDLAKRVVHVRQRADRWDKIGAPKSRDSAREIPLSPMVVNTLREWRLVCPKSELGLVFPDSDGQVESYHHIVRGGLAPLLRTVGIETHYGLHAFRHFFASWVIEQGFSPKRVQALLGHSSIQVTFDVYGHLFPSLEDDHAKFAAGELAIVGGD
jgi:integrase